MEAFLLNIEEIIDNSEKCYAHTAENGKRKETLKEHTEKCQKYWSRIVKKKNLNSIFQKFEIEYLGKLSDEASRLFRLMTANVVTMHDLGKLNPRYQKNKMNHSWNLKFAPDNNIGSRHSILSAVFYLDYWIQRIEKLEDKKEKNQLKDFAYIYAYLISRHHGKLIELERFLDSLSGEEFDGENLGVDAMEWLKVWKAGVMNDKEICTLRKRWKSMKARLQQENLEKDIYLYAMVRLLYSLLTASDYYATSEFMNGIEIQDFGQIENFSKMIETYEQGAIQKSIRTYQRTRYPLSEEAYRNEKEINALRNEIFLESESVLKEKENETIFYLEAPTGSGKSNMAMNLSFHLADADNKRQKIFYIYPFNTLVEQNMNCMEKVFGHKKEIMSQIAVVNSLEPLKDRKEEDESNTKKTAQDYQRILLDRQFLNYPIVLSTHVMLFRTMFGNSREDAFAFYQLCHSVVVLDEIQSYRNDLWSEIIVFLKGLAKLLDIKIIIMSATLPDLELLTSRRENSVNLIKNRKKYFNHPKFARRVTADYSLLEGKITIEELAEYICERETESQKVLVEFIKKATAERFYQFLKEETEIPVLLMTGDSSIQERKDIIKKAEQLSSVILIATQVIEAGVDIDMDIGYKDISKLDSEEQFMGRINRSARKNGIVYFFDMDDAEDIYKKDVRSDKKFTLLNEEIRKLLSDKDFPQFYETQILPLLKQRKEKEDEENLQEFFERKVGWLNMPEIKERMKLIEDNRQMITVYLGRIIQIEDGEELDGRTLWEDYKELLENNEMDYAKKKVQLYEIKSKMNNFIYQFGRDAFFTHDEQIGDIYYIEQGEEYFDENGVLKRELFQDEIGAIFL